MVSLTVNWLQTVLLPDPPFRKIIIPIPIFSQATCQRFKNIVMALDLHGISKVIERTQNK